MAYGERFERALVLAARLHRHQVRKSSAAGDSPIRYVTHLLAVASLVGEQGGDEDAVIAALLHDAVEDHPEELSGLDHGSHSELTEAAIAELARRFNPRVAQLVRSVTNPEYDPGRDRHEQYREHTERGADGGVHVLSRPPRDAFAQVATGPHRQQLAGQRHDQHTDDGYGHLRLPASQVRTERPGQLRAQRGAAEEADE